MARDIIGISAFYHDAACCLLRDGRLLAAAQEERFTRRKHEARLPVEAFRFCLEAGGIGPHEIDAVGYYEQPVRKLSRQLWAGAREAAPVELGWLDPGLPERMIRERLGFDGPILFFGHHQSHAASAFDFSGFSEAALLTVDGVGTWTTTALGRGSTDGIEMVERVSFPHSLGLLYSAVTAYLGFPVNDGEARIMGLAAYGNPRFLDALRALIRMESGTALGYELDMRYFDFVRGDRMFSDALCDLLGAPPRAPASALTTFHQDVAASVQALLEEVLLALVVRLHERVPVANLCLAGGVALNCVANGRIRREGPFANVFVQPAAGDAGGCLGAAALAHRARTGERPASRRLRDLRLGPRWSSEEIADLLRDTGLPSKDFRGDQSGLLRSVAQRLAARQAVGWFQGGMELGPRALGARSLLADPRDPGARDRINAIIKRRESFRPFAPMVLRARLHEHFDLDTDSPFMLETCQVASPLALPAITHVDGSARVQTVDPDAAPRLAALLEAFDRETGCPVLLNTSFNRAGEPIVCSPIDALFTFAESGMDALVLEDFVLDRDQLPASWADLLPAWGSNRAEADAAGNAIDHNLYTFV